MNKKTLVYARGLFLLIIIVSLGLIIVNEKKGELLSHKIDKKFNSYIETNFAGQDFKKSNIVSLLSFPSFILFAHIQNISLFLLYSLKGLS